MDDPPLPTRPRPRVHCPLRPFVGRGRQSTEFDDLVRPALDPAWPPGGHRGCVRPRGAVFHDPLLQEVRTGVPGRTSDRRGSPGDEFRELVGVPDRRDESEWAHRALEGLVPRRGLPVRPRGRGGLVLHPGLTGKGSIPHTSRTKGGRSQTRVRATTTSDDDDVVLLQVGSRSDVVSAT